MRGLVQFGLTVGSLVLAGLFIASASGNVTVEAFDQPGVAGRLRVQFALAFALVIGWSLGGGVEAVWNDKDTGADELLWVLAIGALPRLFGGFFLFFVVIGIEFGFEALGVGLGARS